MSADPQEADPNQLGYSLANVAEILFGCLEAVEPKSVLEIGAFKGELTEEILEWAKGRDVHVATVEPVPPPEVLAVLERHPELELLRETSHAALAHVARPDAIVIDGDHNYFTLHEELRLIEERSPAATCPLVMFHDMCWPHARRDTYYAPERIPEEHRQPLALNAGLAPGEPGVTENGLPFEAAAEREGGERNGTLTAVEDFVKEREGFRLVVVPAFFGFGVLWHEDAPWAGAVRAQVDHWDRHPVLMRLEANRVAHLVSNWSRARELERVYEELGKVRERAARQEVLLRKLLESNAFAMAERISSVRQGGRPRISRAEVREALGEENGKAAG